MQNDLKVKAAKEALIYGVLQGYWQIAEKLTEEFLATYVNACEDCSVESLRIVCNRIASGRAGLNSSFPPTPADIAGRAAMLDDTRKPSIPLHSGILQMDWGHGTVDMRGLTVEEQDEVIRLHGRAPDGRNLALMTLDEKRAALKQEKIEATVKPRLQRMTEG